MLEGHPVIKKSSEEWTEFIRMLNFISYKANREVLCTKCWQLLSTKQKIKHLKNVPNHRNFILTSSHYSSENKIYELAIANNKVFKSKGQEYIYSPMINTKGRILPIESKLNQVYKQKDTLFMQLQEKQINGNNHQNQNSSNMDESEEEIIQSKPYKRIEKQAPNDLSLKVNIPLTIQNNNPEKTNNNTEKTNNQNNSRISNEKLNWDQYIKNNYVEIGEYNKLKEKYDRLSEECQNVFKQLDQISEKINCQAQSIQSIVEEGKEFIIKNQNQSNNNQSLIQLNHRQQEPTPALSVERVTQNNMQVQMINQPRLNINTQSNHK